AAPSSIICAACAARRRASPRHREQAEPKAPRLANKACSCSGPKKGAGCRAPFSYVRFVVETPRIGYIPSMISKAQRIVLVDHARLPCRFFGRLTAVQAGL